MATDSSPQHLTVHSLRCEYFAHPMGVDTPAPRLSWQLGSGERGVAQRSYRILVASAARLLSAGQADIWDSGEVAGEQSVHVPYAGPVPVSGAKYCWTVTVVDSKGRSAEANAHGTWTMGLLHESDWRAQWIASPGYPDTIIGVAQPLSPIMRKEFTAAKPVQSATAFVCGLGYHEVRINGAKAGDHVLDPAFTRYDERTLYVVHDITSHIKTGENAVGVMLGNGWYNCQTKEVWSFEHAPWRDKPKLVLQIEIVYADGSRETIGTDTTWRCSTGPIVFDALRNGEYYDARAEKPGWDSAGYDDAAWIEPFIVPGPGGALNAQLMACRVTDILTPHSVKQIKPGVWLVDMGQNMTGWAQLTIDGPAGETITLRYSEKLADDGDIDQSNIDIFVKDGEFQTDKYTLKGGGAEVWQPRFTYHGFRYIQVTGAIGALTEANFRGCVVRTDFAPAGDFTCSDEVLTKTFANARWSYIGNYVGIPTDCPHREKNGWTGDALIATETGLLMYDAAPAYTKWLDDISDAMRPSGQLPGIVPTGGWGYNWGSGPPWDSAFIGIPTFMHIYSGDVGILAKHYDKMKRYMDFMGSMATDHILSFGLGDWCPPEPENGGKTCSVPLTSTGFYFTNAQALARAARLLGHTSDSLHFDALAETIKAAFNAKFYDPATGCYETQCMAAQSCALYYGMAPGGAEPLILQRLIELIEANEYRPDFGILGAKYVPNVLTAYGRTDVAYKLTSHTKLPGWGHWLTQGATTLWEAWEGGTSRNHIMFGDIAAWMVKAIAGIAPDPAWPGFKRFTIAPNPVGDLTNAEATHIGPYGEIRSAWRVENGKFTLDATIPANAAAVITLPRAAGQTVTESGQPLDDVPGVVEVSDAEGAVHVTVGSGRYVFAVG